MTITITKEEVQFGSSFGGESSCGASIGLGLLAIAQAIEGLTESIVQSAQYNEVQKSKAMKTFLEGLMKESE